MTLIHETSSPEEKEVFLGQIHLAYINIAVGR